MSDSDSLQQTAALQRAAAKFAAFGEALKSSGIDPATFDPFYISEAEWAGIAPAGEKRPETEEDWVRLLVRVGISAERVDKGEWAPTNMWEILAGYFDRLRDSLHQHSRVAPASEQDPALQTASEKRSEISKPPDGDWLVPTSLAVIANKLGNTSTDNAKIILKSYQLQQNGNRQKWTVRLDIMPKNLREKLERA